MSSFIKVANYGPSKRKTDGRFEFLVSPDIYGRMLKTWKLFPAVMYFARHPDTFFVEYSDRPRPGTVSKSQLSVRGVDKETGKATQYGCQIGRKKIVGHLPLFDYFEPTYRYDETNRRLIVNLSVPAKMSDLFDAPKTEPTTELAKPKCVVNKPTLIPESELPPMEPSPVPPAVAPFWVLGTGSVHPLGPYDTFDEALEAATKALGPSFFKDDADDERPVYPAGLLREIKIVGTVATVALTGVWNLQQTVILSHIGDAS